MVYVIILQVILFENKYNTSFMFRWHINSIKLIKYCERVLIQTEGNDKR